MASQGQGDIPPRGVISDADRDAIKQRSEGIGQRLDELNNRRIAARPTNDGRGVAYGQAFKIAAELIAGIVFGGLLGWFLDRYFGTLPLLLVLFVVIGFAAGLLNVIRGAQRAQAQAEPMQRRAPSVSDDEEEN